MLLKKYIQLKSQFEFECKRHNITHIQLGESLDEIGKLNSLIHQLRDELNKEKGKNLVSSSLKVQITLDEFYEILRGSELINGIFHVKEEAMKELTKKLFGELYNHAHK